MEKLHFVETMDTHILEMEEEQTHVEYAERLDSDIEDISGVVDGGLVSDIESVWSSEQVELQLSHIDWYLDIPEPSINDLWKLAVKLGRLVRKLDLTGSKSTPGTIRHMRGLLEAAIVLIKRGATVHLIEGISNLGHQLVGDVDLLYTECKILYQADYTSAPARSGELTVLPEKHPYMLKYKVLRMNQIRNSVPLVITMGFDKRTYDRPISVPIYHSSPREDDFVFADQLIELTRKCTWPDAVQCLAAYARQIDSIVGSGSETIEVPKLNFCSELAELLIGLSGMNNPESAEVNEHFVSSIERRVIENPESAPRIHKFFPCDEYRRIESSMTKHSIPLPVYDRGFHHSDPFARLNELLRLNYSEGNNELLFWKAINGCSMDYTEFKDYSDDKEMDRHFWSNCSIKRVKSKDGSSVDAVRIKFCKGKSYVDFRAFLRSKTGSNVENLNHANLEKQMLRVWDDASKTSVGTRDLDEIESMIDDVMSNNEPSEVIRGLMRRVMHDWGKSAIMTQLSQLQNVTYAILSGMRKSRAIKSKKGSVSKDNGTVTLGLDTVSDLKCVVLYNIGPLDQANLGDVTYMVYGQQISTNEYTKVTLGYSTKILGMSRTQMDWNVTLAHKAISWASLIYESRYATSKKEDKPKLPMMPMFLMFLNSNKFSQASQVVRYLFVNGISLSSGPRVLFDKISWYTPRSNVEKLYMLRMIKMSNTLSANKSTGSNKSVRSKVQTTLGAPGELRDKISLLEWNIAMPDDETSSFNEQSLFNSFYVCKSMSIQRYNKLVSEALVIDKQLDAREDYERIKEKNHSHEGRFLINNDYESLLQAVSMNIDTITNGDTYTPSPIAVSLGLLSTARLMKRPGDKTVGDTLDRVYSADTLVWQMDIRDVMNNRGSVKNRGEHGLSKTGYVEENGKQVKSTQNSKCYITLLDALQDMCNFKSPPKCPEDWKTIEAKVEVELRDVACSGLNTLMDKLWPLVYYFAGGLAACISKMVHKDEIGQREIAVLNAAARVMCKYSESFARMIRDKEHEQGVRVNLIERKDKSKIITNTLSISNKERIKGKKVLYDSADCSKWGPSMMMHILYYSVGARVKDSTHRQVLRNTYSLFGHKVFKIPDEFFLHGSKYSSTGDIRNKVYTRLQNMSENIGSFANQIIYLEESMHQGICGCASSVLGSDAQNLSNFVTQYNMRKHKLFTISHITSDDYSRVIIWDDKEAGTFQIGKKALSQHTEVLKNCGIKRNMQKSGLSDSYWEFNSEFYCPTGEIRPDIKSRLSYIDFNALQDPYDVSLRPMTQAAEFLRVEGSLLGSCWTFVLNNHLALIQNQGRQLYKRVASDIYRLPLELGGMVKPDPILSVISSTLLPLLPNYERFPNDDPNMTLSTILGYMRSEPEMIEVSDKDSKIKIPSFSRSGVVSLIRRATRNTRHIREYLMSLDHREFIDAFEDRKHGSLVLALMACAKREMSQGWNDGSAMNYGLSQVKYEKPCFRINNLAMMQSENVVSRKELHDMALKFLDTRMELDVFDVPTVDTSRWTMARDQMMSVLNNTKVYGLEFMPRFVKLERFRETYASMDFVKLNIDKFEQDYLPQSLGGITDLHPWEFIESKVLYKNRLEKLSRRRQDFRMALRERDEDRTTWTEKIMLSNFAGGCRLRMRLEGRTKNDLIPKISLKESLNLEDKTEMNDDGIVVDLLSEHICTLVSNKRVRAIDLTNFCNVMIGADNRVVVDHEKQQELLAKLKTMCKSGYKFVVSPRSLAKNFSEKRYCSSTGVSLTQLPLYNDNGQISGREIYENKDEKYIHHKLALYNIHIDPPNTSHDEYVSLDLTESQECQVVIEGKKGFTVLNQPDTGVCMQVFSQIDIGVSTIELYMKNSIEGDKALLRRLNLKEYLKMPKVLGKDILNTMYNFPIEMTDAIDEEPFRASVDTASSVDSESSDAFSEMSDMSSELDDDIIAEMEEKGVCDAIDDEDKSSTSSDDLCSDAPSQASSTGKGLVRPSDKVIEVLVSQNVEMLPEEYIIEASNYNSEQYTAGYEIKLPFDLKKDFYVDRGDMTALELLLEQLLSLPEDEAEWAKHHILTSIAQFAPIRSVLLRMDAPVQSRSGRQSKFMRAQKIPQ